MKAPDHITIDFETDPIHKRPQYPPIPRAVAILHPQDRTPRKYMWGLPEGNNCTRTQARNALLAAYESGLPILTHHGKFDLDVAETHMDMKPLPWQRTHDTEYLLFLNDPHQRKLSLKPSAERLLKMKPEERDAVQDWVIKNVPEAKKKKSEWGAYICRAPGSVLGPYMGGDVIRTDKLFKHLYPLVVEAGMLAPYQRELRLMPVLLKNERVGIRCDWKRLERDYLLYTVALAKAEGWLRLRLKSPTLDFNKKPQVAEAFDRCKIIKSWTWTAPTKAHPLGVRSTSKKNMTLFSFADKKVASVYGYRQRLATCLSTFFEPWLEMCRRSGGQIYTNWNSVRQDREGGTAGARTGRLSSNPNFQNIPKDLIKKGKDEGFFHPAFFRSLPPLPEMRRYILPDKGDVFGHRDYSQQELRLVAHFEDGALLAKYNADPEFDMHDDVMELMHSQGLMIERDPTKILNFGDVYGMGATEFANKTGFTIEQAKEIKKVKRAMMPDFDELEDDIKERGQAGIPIKTWGERLYFCEPPMYVKKFKRIMTFEYKMLNYLIQGSAADCTKEAVIQYDNHPERQARFLLTVHDEINSSMPRGRWRDEMRILRECMEGIGEVNPLGLTMWSDAKVGPNWKDTKKYEDPGGRKFAVTLPKGWNRRNARAKAAGAA